MDWREAIAKNHEDYARYVREGRGHCVRPIGSLERLEIELEKLAHVLHIMGLESIQTQDM